MDLEVPDVADGVERWEEEAAPEMMLTNQEVLAQLTDHQSVAVVEEAAILVLRIIALTSHQSEAKKEVVVEAVPIINFDRLDIAAETDFTGVPDQDLMIAIAATIDVEAILEIETVVANRARIESGNAGENGGMIPVILHQVHQVLLRPVAAALIHIRPHQQMNKKIDDSHDDDFEICRFFGRVDTGRIPYYCRIVLSNRYMLLLIHRKLKLRMIFSNSLHFQCSFRLMMNLQF